MNWLIFAVTITWSISFRLLSRLCCFTILRPGGFPAAFARNAKIVVMTLHLRSMAMQRFTRGLWPQWRKCVQSGPAWLWLLGAARYCGGLSVLPVSKRNEAVPFRI